VQRVPTTHLQSAFFSAGRLTKLLVNLSPHPSQQKHSS
jgi:hypothetical protein